jgi:hypothetical protein
MKDGVEKNRIRGSVDGAIMMSEMIVMLEMWGRCPAEISIFW